MFYYLNGLGRLQAEENAKDPREVHPETNNHYLVLAGVVLDVHACRCCE